MKDNRTDAIPAENKDGHGYVQSPASQPGFAEECARQALLTRQADREDVWLDVLLDEGLADLDGGASSPVSGCVR
jgi:hypothetical protein